MKTKHLSTVLLWGWVLALGALMFSCSNDDDEVIGDEEEVIDNVIENSPAVYLLRGEHYGFWDYNHVTDITGVLCVDPQIDGLSVQDLYVEDTTTQDRYYLFESNAQEIVDFLYGTYTELSEEGEYISKGISVSMNGDVHSIKTTEWNDWTELMDQGIQLFCCYAEVIDNIVLEQL